ncbi:MAG: alanine racemase [Alphaproteobacteria bacterium]|nr:alanine racemase [Alphaproteobacteria bacterium]
MINQSPRDTACLEINLTAIYDNYIKLAKKTGPALCASVVKADAYGLGLQKIIPILIKAGCKHFFVATIDEGIELRHTLQSFGCMDAYVFILYGPIKQTLSDFLWYDLIPVLNNFYQIELWLSFSKQKEKKLKAALHLDTGMSRLGLMASEINKLITKYNLFNMDILLIMSHLACADVPEHSMNAKQLRLFNERLSDLSRILSNPWKSLAASSGIFLDKTYYYDLVRPGAALWGINPTPSKPNPMATVVNLWAPVLQVHEIDTNGCVGYGATRSFSKPKRLATLALGYADGLLRSLSNQGVFWFKKWKLNVVGRISMDLVTVDIEDVPMDQIHPGDMVEIMGLHHSVDQLALEAGTIGYEILTSLGQRLTRYYSI